MANSNSKAQKKLPKRTSNAHRKAYRAALWAKQKKRKAARQAKQDEAHRRNLEKKAA
jgi:hypothetical protein